MTDNDIYTGKILGSIAALIMILWTLIQINKETSFINSIKLFIINCWVWFIRAKIPLSWIPLGLIVYYLGKYFLKENKEVKDTRKRENISLIRLLDDRMYRTIILYCDKPRSADKILTKITKSVSTPYGETWKINVIIRKLEEHNGLIFIEEDNTWLSSQEALDIIAKYHGD